MKIWPPERFVFPCCALGVFAGLAVAQAPTAAQPSAATKRPVTDEYQGVKVGDDYRWLENWDDADVKEWTAAQNAWTRAYLDGLRSRPSIKTRMQKLIGGSSPSHYDLVYRAGRLLAMKYTPPQQQPNLVVLRSADDSDGAKVILDLNAMSAKGSTAVDFFAPSRDGKLVAAALSENGSEDSAAHVFEVSTGKELSDRVPRVNFATAGGSIAWKGDGSGFYYTRYPQDG